MAGASSCAEGAAGGGGCGGSHGSAVAAVAATVRRQKPRRASWESDLQTRRAVVARSWYGGYGALAEEEEEAEVDVASRKNLVMPSLKNLVSMATLSRRRSSSTTALNSRETVRATPSAAKSVTAIPLLRDPLRKCETAVTLSSMIPPVRPVNRLRVSTNMCSRCSSILSMASSSRYSINTTGFVNVSECRSNVMCKLCLNEVPPHLTWTLQHCSCTFCVEVSPVRSNGYGGITIELDMTSVRPSVVNDSILKLSLQV